MTADAMLETAFLLLVLAALGGLTMAGIRFARKANPPITLSMLHGLLAAAGLTLVAYAVLRGEAPAAASIALVLLLLAAAGGAALTVVWHWPQRLLPSTVVVGHALFAVAGFVMLYVAAYGT